MLLLVRAMTVWSTGDRKLKMMGKISFGKALRKRVCSLLARICFVQNFASRNLMGKGICTNCF